MSSMNQFISCFYVKQADSVGFNAKNDRCYSFHPLIFGGLICGLKCERELALERKLQRRLIIAVFIWIWQEESVSPKCSIA